MKIEHSCSEVGSVFSRKWNNGSKFSVLGLSWSSFNGKYSNCYRNVELREEYSRIKKIVSVRLKMGNQR